MSVNLSGQVGLVTGASSGIGLGIAHALARAGAAVAINHHSHAEPAEHAASEIVAAGGRARAFSAPSPSTEQEEATMVEQLNRSTAQPERERAISERAYVIWDEKGQPEGKHLEHWLRAEPEHRDRSGSVVPPDRPSDRAQTTAPRLARVGKGVRAAGAGGGEEAGSFPQAGEAPATRQLRRKA